MLDCVVVIKFYLLVLPKVFNVKRFFFLFFKHLIFFPISKPFDFPPHQGGGYSTLYMPEKSYTNLYLQKLLWMTFKEAFLSQSRQSISLLGRAPATLKEALSDGISIGTFVCLSILMP